ncbi:MAG TPA: hypothetical protein P5262_04895 [Candidatus Moranbacteria bacterium]|nr:hypothetical protein [Candidatus Moranbacteria bacterium]
MKGITVVLTAVLFIGLSAQAFAQNEMDGQSQTTTVATMTCPKGNFYTSAEDVTLHILSKGVPEIGISYHPDRDKTQRMVLCDDKQVPTPWLSGPKFSIADIAAVKKMYLNDGPFICSGSWIAATKLNGKAAYSEVTSSGGRPKVFIRQK